jgi:hypothetical protein
VKPVVVVNPDHQHPVLEQPTVHVNPKDERGVIVVHPVINLYNDLATGGVSPGNSVVPLQAGSQ